MVMIPKDGVGRERWTQPPERRDRIGEVDPHIGDPKRIARERNDYAVELESLIRKICCF